MVHEMAAEEDIAGIEAETRIEDIGFFETDLRAGSAYRPCDGKRMLISVDAGDGKRNSLFAQCLTDGQRNIATAATEVGQF